MDLMQETQNLPNNYITSGLPQPAISKEMLPKMASKSPENRTYNFCTKKTEEEISPRCTEDAVVMMDKANSIQRSLLPTSCLSPVRNLSEPYKEISRVSKCFSISALRSSISRKSLKEIQQEDSNPIVQIPVSIFINLVGIKRIFKLLHLCIC